MTLAAAATPTAELSTLLVVDDTPENLTILTELLRPRYRVRVANSGKRALAVAVTEPRPDLILLDVMMPEMSGHDVLDALKMDPRTRSIPVIFVTAMDADEDEQIGLALGAVDYITKPLRPAIVRSRVHTQLELKLARDRLQDQNVFLEAEVARRMHENVLIQDVSIRALARLAETRDPETGSHILRTQEYVRLLAQLLQTHPRFAHALNDSTIESLAKSAPLHDIGKVGIPDRILLKPGKLTPEEWVIMRTHTTLGAEAIAQAERDSDYKVEFLRYAKEIARSHHEKWNGSGYPDGLRGDEIPISARLMALADVFDALTCRRVYKEAFPFERSRDIIIEGRGQHFDPDVVDAFAAHLEQFRAIAVLHADVDPIHVVAKEPSLSIA